MKSHFDYLKLGYAALNVTDLDRSVRFYTDLMGLDLTERTGEVAYLRCSRDHHNLVLYASPTPGIRRAAYQLASAADLDAAFAAMTDARLAPRWLPDAECKALNQGPSFRVREPHTGLVFEFYDRMTHMATPYQQRLTQIARIGHVVLGTPEYQAAIDQVTGPLNFAVSDFVEGKFSWMRCRPNPLHHSLAIGASDRRHLHHINFMVTDIDDIGRAASRMKKAGVDVVFGPGRHLPSTSIFLYFLDPDGMTMEFSFGMEELHEGTAREPRMLQMHPETMDIWGSTPDPRFGKTGAIDGDHD